MADLTLGAQVDPATSKRTDTPCVVASGDLTTHGVIVGMTGSGKTGLGVVLIEECLSAGVPALLIDPKGDLTNLCLTFPNLAAADFAPWVNPGDAQKAGQTVDQYAAAQADAWRAGLADWGIGPERIAALREKVDFTIYTPGSTAGRAVNIVGALNAPAAGTDPEAIRDEVAGYVSGLLGLVGIDADPLASREHILLSNLIETAWSAGKNLDLATLVGQVQTPPMRKLGVLELDAFFPPADRTALAMRLNGLIASPSFAAWAQGTPLSIQDMLFTPSGTPRCAIVTTSHLSDEERQFVTALVLGKVVTWMRGQSGTTDLRALVYMDEVAGYVPPTAAPPTKAPIMTLMKQARAFGVGLVLSTQNPVDIDYKAISNAGTWMIGRLQTERDKSRLLEGMSAAAGGTDLAALGDQIGGLAKRQFVLRRAGKDAPELMTTRWAMSYLRGPLTREQIAQLMGTSTSTAAAAPAPAPVADGASAAPTPADAPAPAAPPVDDGTTPVAPAVASGVGVFYADPGAPWLEAAGADPRGTARSAAILARVSLRYDDTAADLVHDEEYEAVVHPLTSVIDATKAIAVDYDDRDLSPAPPDGVRYHLPDADLAAKTTWTRVEKDLVDALVRGRSLDIQANKTLKIYSRPGEDEAAFAARCEAAADERADAETAKLRAKYDDKIRRLEDQRATAADRQDVLEAQAKSRRNSDLLHAAGSILGGLLGGRRNTRSMAGAVIRGIGGARGGGADGRRIEAAGDKVSRLDEGIQRLEDELSSEVLEIQNRWDAAAKDVTVSPVALEKTDVRVTQLVLAWLPAA